MLAVIVKVINIKDCLTRCVQWASWLQVPVMPLANGSMALLALATAVARVARQIDSRVTSALVQAQGVASASALAISVRSHSHFDKRLTNYV